MKRPFAIVLCLVMILSLSVVPFAAANNALVPDLNFTGTTDYANVDLNSLPKLAVTDIDSTVAKIDVSESMLSGYVNAKILWVASNTKSMAISDMISVAKTYTVPKKMPGNNAAIADTAYLILGNRGQYVNNVFELKDAINYANANGGNYEIICNNGTYNLMDIGYNFGITASNITVRGNNPSDRDNVILTGDKMAGNAVIKEIFWVKGDNFTCENMTLKNVGWHAIQITGENGTSNTVIRNVHFMDTWEQMIKVSAAGNPSSSSIYSENGLVENCLFEFSAGKAGQYYTCAIDGHHTKNWIVRNNTIKDIKNPGGWLTEPAIHFWNGSTGVLIEGNTITNSERGIYIGMGTDSICSGNIIRNNTVTTIRDVGIGIENAPNTIIDNNTCYTGNDYPFSIEYRWVGTTGTQITNNKTNGTIQARDGATATLISGNTIFE